MSWVRSVMTASALGAGLLLSAIASAAWKTIGIVAVAWCVVIALA